MLLLINFPTSRHLLNLEFNPKFLPSRLLVNLLGIRRRRNQAPGSQIPNYGGSPSGNGSKKGIIIGVVIGAVILLAGLAVALFLVFGDSDENTESAGIPNEDTSESAGIPNEDTSDIVSKMNRIASAVDMECELLEGEEKRAEIGEFDETAGFGNEEFADLVIETFEDLTLFKCEREDWEFEYQASYPAERHLSVVQATLEDSIKYDTFPDDARQLFRSNAEFYREQCMDDSKRTELNEGYIVAATELFLQVEGFIFTIPFSSDLEDFQKCFARKRLQS